MSDAYERVCAALEGTPLSGQIDALNASLHLTPDAPEWIIAALTAIGSAAMQNDLQAVERHLIRLPDVLAESMRAAAAELVKDLANDIARDTTEAIKNKTIALMVGIADKMETFSDSHAAEISATTKQLSQHVEAEVVALSSIVSESSKRLSRAADHLRGWSSSRFVTLAFGVIAGAAMFFVGSVSHTTDFFIGCNARVEHLVHANHLAPRTANLLRAQICNG